MKYNKNIPYYLIVAGFFIFLKFLYSHATTDEIIYLLQPTNFIIELISNSESQYLPSQGYYNSHLNILIDKSCSGFNFLMLCYLMLVFSIVSKLQNNLSKVIVLPLLLLSSYLLTIFINSSRIMISIFIRELGFSDFIINESWLHQLEGTFVYLFFLIIVYLTIDTLFKTSNSTKQR